MDSDDDRARRSRRVLCWAAKGGSGLTTVVATLGLQAARPVLLVDLAGDLDVVFGVETTAGRGVDDWIQSTTGTDRLATLEVPVTDNVTLLPWSGGLPVSRNDDRWRLLAGALLQANRDVIIDAGSGEPHPALAAIADRRVLVTRPCYLSLRLAGRHHVRPTDVVVVDEPGRRFRPHDIENALGAPVTAHTMVDPAVARAIDSGLVVARLPRGFRRQIEQLAA